MIQLAVSLGGVQSLIEIAGSMTHPEKYISAAERKEGGLSESLVRFRYALIVVLVTLLVRPCIEMTYRNYVLFCVDSHTLDFIPGPCDKKGLRSYTGYPILYYVHTKQESKKEFFRGMQIKQSTADEVLPCTGTGDGSRVQGLVSPDFQGKDVFILAMSSNNRSWVQV